MMRSLALLVALFGIALAHSWLGCADYHIRQDSDAQVFNPANCKAWGRNWKNLGNPGGTFGLDNGYDFLTNAPVCRDNAPQPLSNGYSATWPMAQYTPGQNVCLAWPAKNHVAASCNNPYIPDNGLNIWVSKANPTSNPTVGDLTLVKAFPKNTASNQYTGFQNCPQFCGNQDKATCTGCFTVPSDLQPGATYTFVWAWAFNGQNQLYSNCWEAQVGSTDPNFTFPPTTAAPTQQTTQQQTSQQQTSQPTTQQTSQQQTSQQPTSQQTSQQTQTQSPSTSVATDCISQCVQICGARGVDSCNCAGGFNVVCGKKDDESTSSASMIAMSAFAVASAILF